MQQDNFQGQIIDLSQRMDKGFCKLETMLQAMDERMRAIEQNQAGSHPVFMARLDAAWRQIEEHKGKIGSLDTDIQQIKLVVETLKSTKSLAGWIGGVLSGAALTWIVVKLLELVR